MTTNASIADQLPEDAMASIMDVLNVVQVSIYGLDRDEHLAITGVDDFDVMTAGLRRIVSMRTNLVRVAVGSGKSMEPSEVRSTVHQWLNNIPVRCPIEISGPLRQFANWGLFGDTAPLFDGSSWKANTAFKSQCLHPLFALKVFWTSDVSACACGDYDGHPDLSLGNVQRETLAQMCGSQKSAIAVLA